MTAEHAKRSLLALGLATLVMSLAVAKVATARADSTPIRSLPPGPVSTITTSPNQYVAIALPHATARSGLVWRVARRYDSTVIRQVSEADVQSTVVLVFKVVGRGNTSLVFGLTRGDTSPKAVKSATHNIVSR
jgi:hypothetical protein